MTLKTLNNRKKPNYSSPRYSRKFNRISKPNSLRSKVFKFMQEFPHSTLTQATNYFQDDYRYKIHDLIAFKLILQIYRHQYWSLRGKPYTPPKDQLEQIRRGYEIPLRPVDFSPNIEVVADKIVEKEQSELERLKAMAIAVRSFNS